MFGNTAYWCFEHICLTCSGAAGRSHPSGGLLLLHTGLQSEGRSITHVLPKYDTSLTIDLLGQLLCGVLPHTLLCLLLQFVSPLNIVPT